MQTLAAFLLSIVGPLTARILLSLGLSAVTLTGLTAAGGVLKDMITSNIGGMPSVALQLGGLLGLWQAVGIWLGAVTFVISWRAASTSWAFAKSAT